MRRYDIVSGILLILSIIDFTLTAPVTRQEKRQERVNVVRIPKDTITLLGKRWEEDLEKLGEEFLKTGGKPVESSSSLPLGPDHGSTNAVQPSAPNSASSTANPDPLMEPSSCSSSTSSRQGLSARGNCVSGLDDLEALPLTNDDGGMLGPLISDVLEALYLPPSLNPIPKVPNSRPVIDPSADPNFPWDFWIDAEDPPPRPASQRPESPEPEPEIIPQLHKYQVYPPKPPSTSGYGPSPPENENENEPVTPPSGSLNLGSPKEPDDGVAPLPPPSADTGLPLNHLSLSPDAQPLDLQAAIYAAKGKAKESRRVTGTTRDVGNVAQQPAERSLDPGE